MIFKIFGFTIMIFNKKEVFDMAAIYTALIIKGVRTFSSIPPTVKEKVRQMLIDIEMEELIDE